MIGFRTILIVVFAASLLVAGLPPGAALARQDVLSTPEPDNPPAHLSYEGLLNARRVSAAAPVEAQETLAPSSLPYWSRVVFQSARNNHDWEIYAVDAYGNNPVNLSNHPSMDVQPRFNRGATRVVFASNRDGNYEIYAMNADGSGQIRLTDHPADDNSPAWSPDGSRIVFQSYRDSQAEIYVMNADGSGQTRLTNHGDYDGEAA